MKDDNKKDIDQQKNYIQTDENISPENKIDIDADNKNSNPEGYGDTLHRAFIDTLKRENDSLKKENDNLKDLYLRQEADLENIKKRYIKEKEETSLFAIQKFAEDITEVFENLIRALSHISDDIKHNPKVTAIVEGLNMIIPIFSKSLQKYGISRIAPTKGEIFDHKLHQAVAQQPGDEDNIIIELLHAGYSIHDRVIKPAMVVVSHKNN